MTMSLLQKARGKMMIKHPFFATLMVTTPWVERRDLPMDAPMGTDMRTIFYNPEKLEEIAPTVEQHMFIIAHEVMHIALNHGSRKRHRNPIIWNFACDFAINWILKESGMEFPTCGLLDEQYKEMSAEHIYDKLMQDADKARAKGKTGNPEDGPQQSGMPAMDPLQGDLLDPEGGSDPAKQAELDRSIQQRVAQAANVARMAGKVGAGLERFINEILDPKVAWQDLLRDYMTRIVKDDESWSRRNRRFRGVYLPARHSTKMGPIVMIDDTSGSIGHEELKQYNGETQKIAEDLRPESIRIVYCDARVAGEQLFEEGDFSPDKVKPMGGGGTDMRVALDYVTRYDPEIVILFTDGYTPWPDVPPEYPLIVVCTTDVAVPDIGQVVRV